MKLDANDPRLTAYVLGELNDAARAKVEAALQSDAALRREVDAIRRTTEQLTTELQAEPCPELSSVQQRAIADSLHQPTSREPVFTWSRFWWSLGLAGATVALIICMCLPALNRARLPSRQVAFNQTPAGVALPFADTAPPPDAVFRDFEYHGPTLGGGGGTPGKAPGGVPMVAGNTPTEYKASITSQETPPFGEVIGVVSDIGGAVRPSGTPGGLAAPSIGLGDGTIGTAGVKGPGGGGFGQRVGPVRSQMLKKYNTVKDGGRVDWQQSSQYEDGQRYYPGGEAYHDYGENPFAVVTQQPLSTFGLDVDTASYANIRRFINERQRPPRDAVRIEEMLNYFSYDYAPPRRGEPFALHVELAACPWNPAHRLALIGLKAKDVPAHKRPASNLVFLIDVSGSMQPVNKLPLIKRAFHLLVNQLDERDRVAIVVYANNARVVLHSTSAADKDRILAAIDSLEANGSTNGGEGIQWAYDQARQNFIQGGVNRVILCTDGDFNVGITDQAALIALIQQQAKTGVFLSVLGFGMGNVKDSTMQKLADNGNGHYAYVDDLDEARKVFVDQLQATLVTVAKDAKLQIEFNPAVAQAYRLIGYEKRQLRAQDFNNDRKDAGEVGAGHTVTALYEIVPVGAPGEPGVDPLKYQPQPHRATGEELLTVKLRYKEPDSDTSKLLTAAVKDSGARWDKTSDDFRFAAAVAAFGLVLRDSPYRGQAGYETVLELATSARGRDAKGYRSEFINLVRQAQTRAP